MRGWAIAALIGWAILVGYTTVVIAEHGFGLLPIFFGDIALIEWPGQFNLDFLLMLAVSASWTAWRNGFRPTGLVLGLIALVGGSGFLLPYLAYLIFRHRADPGAVLLGANYRGTSE